MKNLFALAGLLFLAASLKVSAAPPDFSLCEELPAKNGLRGICYGYQASGCSYLSEEQNCFQLELLFAEKALELDLDPEIPGSQIPCLAEPRSCFGALLTYSVSIPGVPQSPRISCDFNANSIDDCAGRLADFCYEITGEDVFTSFQSQVAIDKMDECGLE